MSRMLKIVSTLVLAVTICVCRYAEADNYPYDVIPQVSSMHHQYDEDGQDGRLLQSSINTVRINAGSLRAWTDPATGNVWGKDAYFQNGVANNACPKNISGTTLDTLYCSERYFGPTGTTNGTYTIPLPPGKYNVSLLFAEAFFTQTGERVFSIFVQKVLISSNLDLYAVTGSINAAYNIIVQATVTSSDSNIRISFVNVKNYAKISAIEIKPTGTAPVPTPVPSPTKTPVSTPTPMAPTPQPIVRINAGSGKVWTDLISGIVWDKDTFFQNGATLNKCPRNISGTIQDTLYCSERFFGPAGTTNGTYTIPVLPGQYDVSLMFAETFFNKTAGRVFSVFVQGMLVSLNLDIFAMTGSIDSAYKISAPATVTSGDSNIRILFQNIKNFAKISAIEIKPAGTAPRPTPVAVPAKTPTTTPTKPISAPTNPPASSLVLIDCGSTTTFTDSLARTWSEDKYFTGGSSASKVVAVEGTVDDTLYHFERAGSSFSYEIPLANGAYEINLFFSETTYTLPNQRLFDVQVEKAKRENIDIFKLAGANTATKITFFEAVDDGSLSILFKRSSIATAGFPKINAIEVKFEKPHITHAVATGPYTGTVVDTSGKAKVQLVGQTSHTHGIGLNLVNYVWKEAGATLGTDLNLAYDFTPGNHTISLTVKDDGGFEDTEVTSVTIKPFGYPAITQLVPSSGNITGNYDVIIRGSGFNYSAAETIVSFGQVNLTASAIQIINASAIKVKAPSTDLAIPMTVSVLTPLGKSDVASFGYVGTVPILWESGKVADYEKPTVGRFGPDQKLYMGNRYGRLLKITLNADFTKAINIVDVLANLNKEAILGIAFDPTDTKSNPDVYFTASKLFHKGTFSSSGTSINGRIRRASGPSLETIINIVTGLPVADLDHALNGLEFGDKGELYFCIGSNTNGGIPGQLSSSKLLKENFLSAAVNVAYLSHPDFDGSVRWSAPDNGNMIAKGIDLFAMGLRNPYSIVMHSNGKLYGTDNGPNPSYGRMSTGCGDGDNIDDAKSNDEVNHLQKGKYYGHPNKKRAAVLADPRQCVWYPASTPSNAGYTAPLITGQSSIDGILEFHGNHFGGQLRYNLIFLRYNGLKNIFRVILTPDGSAVLPSIKTPIPLDLGELGLDLTQAPNGNLIEMRYGGDTIFYHKPKEAVTAAMLVKTVFPRRGVNGGGNTLYVYGVNFKTAGPAPTVQVGGKECPVTLVSSTRIDCTLPGGAGSVDIVVNQGSERSIFERGYRYISGVHSPGFVLPIYTG